MMTFMKARFAQQFRDQVRKHTRDALRKKAEAGLVAGCKIFGYDNEGPKGHRERRINETEAVIVRDIYARAAAGEGCRSIAKALNRARVPKPRAQQGRADGWSASTVRAVLERPLYRGVVIYGRSAKAYDRELKKVYPGTKREKGQVRRPEDTWSRIEMPELRIVEPDLAERADTRRSDRRTRYLASLTRSDGRMPENAHGQYLLSGGMLICPQCGGHFEARKYPWKGHPPHVYICSTRRRKPGVCTNTLALPIAETDDDTLSVVEDEILAPQFIDQLLSLLDSSGDDVAALTRERERLSQEVKRLVNSIAEGVPVDTVASAIRDRERAARLLEVRLRAPRRAPNVERLRAVLEQRADEWKAELRAEPKVDRLALRPLVGPLTLHDESTRPDFIPFVRWSAPTKGGRIAGWDGKPTVHVLPER